jgi:alkyl sulfatase BDS1-like metallo-beta-lactamase superfamily hydrolase
MTDLTNVDDYANIDPQQFGQLVKNTPDAKLKDLLSGERRKTILDGIFARMPLSFRPDQAGDTQAIIHWTLTGGPSGSDTYEVRIADGKCETQPGTTTETPRLAVTIDPVDFIKVVSGNANPVMMFMTGKIKAKGDLGLAANIGKLFSIPKA